MSITQSQYDYEKKVGIRRMRMGMNDSINHNELLCDCRVSCLLSTHVDSEEYDPSSILTVMQDDCPSSGPRVAPLTTCLIYPTA